MARVLTPAYRKARTAALRRDGNECVKCGSDEKLQAHHIIPVDKGGNDDVSNLTTLCQPCHREWEMLAAGSIPLDEWIELLPLAHILNIIHHTELWRDDISASTMRKMFSSDSADVSDAFEIIAPILKIMSQSA